jgi:hypothetical protein
MLLFYNLQTIHFNRNSTFFEGILLYNISRAYVTWQRVTALDQGRPRLIPDAR